MDVARGVNSMQTATNLQFENPIQSLTRDKTQFITLINKNADPSSNTTKEFMKAEFLKHHNAHITEFMPNLVSIINKAKKVRAAVGYRSADSGELFLEQYLDQPLDAYISEHCGFDVPRDQIVEVGNLTCAANGYARLAIIRLTEMLHESGFRWVGFTATQGLLNSFLRLGLTPHTIGPAEITRLRNNTNGDWGTYYDNNPQVMFGSIDWGFNQLKDERLL
jgi:hypothetical protein